MKLVALATPFSCALWFGVTGVVAFLCVDDYTRQSVDLQSNALMCAHRHEEISRRKVFGVLGWVTIFSLPIVARGTDEPNDGTTTTRKPFAPIEYLLPATRVKLYIDKAVDAAKTLAKLDPDDSQKEQIVSQLEALLLEPHSFMSRQESSKAKTYLDMDYTWDEWSKARRTEAKNMMQQQSDPVTSLNESFEQWGERRQFKRLRTQQLALEAKNPMRAALNMYTNNLRFGESYVLTASKEEKSRLIRQYNQLPDVTSVVRADLDLRDLYRNQLLTKMDDARAELVFQLSQEKVDATELLSLLSEAQASCSSWFSFIPESDQSDALKAVLAETQ